MQNSKLAKTLDAICGMRMSSGSTLTLPTYLKWTSMQMHAKHFDFRLAIC